MEALAEAMLAMAAPSTFHKFKVGEAVMVRDKNHCSSWKPARVTSTSPLLVKVDGWSWSTSWDEVCAKDSPPTSSESTGDALTVDFQTPAGDRTVHFKKW